MNDDDLRALALRVASELDEAESRNTIHAWQSFEREQRALFQLTALCYRMLEAHLEHADESPAQQARRRPAVEALRDLRAATHLTNMGHVGSAARLADAIAAANARLRTLAARPDPFDGDASVDGEPPLPDDAPLPEGPAPARPPLHAMLGEGFQVERVHAGLQGLIALGSDLVRLIAATLPGAFAGEGIHVRAEDIDGILERIRADTAGPSAFDRRLRP